MMLVVYFEEDKFTFNGSAYNILEIDQISGKALEYGIMPEIKSKIVRDKFSGTVTQVIYDKRETNDQFPNRIHAHVGLKDVKWNTENKK